jgi:hypothetical protein
MRKYNFCSSFQHKSEGRYFMRALIYDGSIPLKAKNIFNCTDSIPNCKKVKSAIAAQSIDHAISELEKRKQSAPQGFDVIAFCGHAAEGSFGVAGNTSPSTGLQRTSYDKKYDFQTGKLQDIQGELQRLKQVMKDDAIIYFSGCNVAQDAAGANLLIQLSNILSNVWISGIIEEAAVVPNEGAQQVELHRANNQQDKGIPETLGLKVAYNGMLVDDAEEWPENLVEKIAYWPYND